MENNNKKINELTSNDKRIINFGWNDDEELISNNELNELVKKESNKIKENLEKSNKSNKGRIIMSMEKYRDMMYSAYKDGTLGMSYDEINKTHNKLYGCDFEPKF